MMSMTIPKGRRGASACVLALLLLTVPLPSIAQSLAQTSAPKRVEPKPQGLQLERVSPKIKAKRAAERQLLQKKRARDAVNGYYQALIKGDYEQAGSFAHPDAIEPVRKELIKRMTNVPAAQKRATLKNLGASDLGALQSLTTTQFFANYARSSYATKLQSLADPRRKASVKIKTVRCDPSRPVCLVSFDLLQTLDDGSAVKGSNQVRAANIDGRWLVGEGLGK